MTDKKKKIIFAAAKLFHANGYNNVGIKKILDTLSIPKGSFYHFFSSKDELVLNIIELYIEDTANLTNTVENSIDGVKELFNTLFNRLHNINLSGGCPVGNLILELSDEKEEFRLKLLDWYNLLEQWIINILNENNIDNSQEKAASIIAAFEGIVMLSKLTKKSDCFETFNKHIFPNLIFD